MKLISSLIVLNLIIFSFSGCSTKTQTIKKKMSEIPEVAQTNLSEVLSCVKNDVLLKEPTSIGYTFVIKDISDGTVRPNEGGSPLSDSGKLQLANTLNKYIPKTSGIVVANYPQIFRYISKGGIGLNRFGMLPSKEYKIFSKNYLKMMNLLRKWEKIKPISRNNIFLIEGAFTAFDTESVFLDGVGADGGNKGSDADVDLDYGFTKTAQSLTLSINISQPKYNLIDSSEAFTLRAYRDKETFRLKFKAGEGYFGFADEKLEVEGIHNAQQALIETATLWIISKMVDDDNSIINCFNSFETKNKDLNLSYGKEEFINLINAKDKE